MLRLVRSAIVLVALAATPSFAADLVVKAPRKVVVERTEIVDCLRWIRQTQSWYNYCDPVPIYGLPVSHYDGFLFADPRWRWRGPYPY